MPDPVGDVPGEDEGAGGVKVQLCSPVSCKARIPGNFLLTVAAQEEEGDPDQEVGAEEDEDPLWVIDAWCPGGQSKSRSKH